MAISTWVAWPSPEFAARSWWLVPSSCAERSGYWEDTVDTLIITGVSVAVCILIGIPIGIWMSRSKRVTAALTPVLDVMQTMPSFAYLAPLVLFFGIGPAAAVVTTLIYALPPLVRISAHGLRTVSPTTLEATTSLGSTDSQQMRKVQLPMARRTILVGLNQTTMAALSMAVIAALINGPGLGVPVIKALQILNVGRGLRRRPLHRPARDHARPHDDRSRRAGRGRCPTSRERPARVADCSSAAVWSRWSCVYLSRQ